MMYPFLQLDDGAEIVHSELLPNNTVKVYVEKPDAKDCFHNMTLYLPTYDIESINGLTKNEIERYMEVIKSTENCIMEYCQSNK